MITEGGSNSDVKTEYASIIVLFFLLLCHNFSINFFIRVYLLYIRLVAHSFVQFSLIHFSQIDLTLCRTTSIIFKHSIGSGKTIDAGTNKMCICRICIQVLLIAKEVGFAFFC